MSTTELIHKPSSAKIDFSDGNSVLQKAGFVRHFSGKYKTFRERTELEHPNRVQLIRAFATLVGIFL